ncbi:DinB family protein [Riemerella anatipestifer]|uniref:DinB family protein n=1 Tax=Riemerella anatipestifer TaxID=34085 RepID=UPI0030BCB0A0
MHTEVLLHTLELQIKGAITTVEILKTKDLDYLTWRPQEHSWNILECIEHFNLYGDFYLPEFESKIKSSHTVLEVKFKSSWLGGYFAKSILPNPKSKMRTANSKNPINKDLDKLVLERFIGQQEKLLELLNLSKSISLNKTKVNISISRWIKLRLGDGFMFYVNHILRHLYQIENIQSAYNEN